MIKSFGKCLAYLLCCAAISSTVFAQTKPVITVTAYKPTSEIQSTMWGLFFEDINFGADGGLYAELVKNKSFEFDVPLMGWSEGNTDRFSLNKQSGNAVILSRKEAGSADESASNTNPRFARIFVHNPSTYSFVNEGFFGMGVKKGITYTFSVYAKNVEGNSELVAELIDDKNQSLGSTKINIQSKTWTKYTGTFVANNTFAKAKLKLSFTEKNVTDVDLISLFPSDTWKNRPNGLRSDLVQLLYDMKPGFLRFPGGCIVEGRDLSQRYQWKKTVGDADERELLVNRWNTEFSHRPAPDYYQSFGIGFYEYFLLSEDLGAKPVPIVSCGMACQFNTAEMVPLDELDAYIQDALDLIEFANGDVTTRWGKLRADMGHPKPFNLEMIGVGNEQWGPEYFTRYAAFEKAISAKYPDIKIISSTGPFADGEMFEFGWESLKNHKADIVDEHYYKDPAWFFNNATRYDNYDRKGPKIFAGEYAAQSVAIASPDNKNNWECALSEAAFMTGLERNADIVHLASYAPLFGHAEGWQWTPDLIWFNTLNAYATPNYYVQQLFSTNAGTHTLPIKLGKENVTGQLGLYASAVWDVKSKEIIVKVVNNTSTSQTPEIKINGKSVQSKAVAIVLTGDLKHENSFDLTPIKPEEKTISLKGNSIVQEVAAHSFTVFKVKTK